MLKPLKLELAIFIVAGGLTVLIDFIIYRGLIYCNLLGDDAINLAKSIGFIGGTIFAYFANRFWTFKNKTVSKGSIGRFALIYSLSLIANIAINHLSILILGIGILNHQTLIMVSFILATGVSAILNFLGMKFFVFNR